MIKKKQGGKMKLVVNEGKKLEMLVKETIYLRYGIQTEFINVSEDYIKVIDKYVTPVYQEKDILFICEKVISLCQNRIVKREDIKIGMWARFLSKFASHKNRGGYGVGMPINMQYAINKVGVGKVLIASILGGITKCLGIKGVFYKIVGREVSGLDGFYDGAWEEYKDIGIEIPIHSNQVCNEIKEKLGISCVIMDANDFGRVILGKSKDIKLSNKMLRAIIKDNPAGQQKEQTPFILVRKKNLNYDMIEKRRKYENNQRL